MSGRSIAFAKMASPACSPHRPHGDRLWWRRGGSVIKGGAIPTTFLTPEEAFAMMDAFVCWQGGCCVDNGGGNVLTLTACKSRQWMAQREWETGGGGRSDEAVAMLPHGGGAADDMTRGGGGAERAVRGMLEADDSTRGGGRDDVRQAGVGQTDDTTRGWGRTT
jgi:hypothetical protein